LSPVSSSKKLCQFSRVASVGPCIGGTVNSLETLSIEFLFAGEWRQLHYVPCCGQRSLS